MKRLLIKCGVLLLLVSGLTTGAAQEPDGRAHHAAVVVQYASGEVATRCVGFDEDSISGYEALQRAGFGVVAEGSASTGAMVCAIDGVGCDYPNEACGCKCQGAECIYWAYSHGQNGVWNYSSLGATAYRVRDGAVEGWAWGSGSVERGSEPPLVAWGDICAAQAAPFPTTIPPTTIPPTAIQPTRVPPTHVPPTRVPPTNVGVGDQGSGMGTVPSSSPTRVAQSPIPITTPTAQPTPTARPAGVIVPSSSPTRVAQSPIPITATTPEPTPDPRPPTLTSQPAGVIVPSPAPTPDPQPPTEWRNYLAFGGIAALFGLGIVVARRRRSQ